MFEWLSRWFQKDAGGSRPGVRAGGRPSARGGRPSNVGKPSSDGVKEAYLESLAEGIVSVSPLTGDEEQRASDLVERVAAFLGTHAIEPPVMPALASRMMELLQAPEVDAIALSRLIERDQATAARLLSITNSAMFRGTNKIETVRDAVVYLGTEQVAQIAMALASRSLYAGGASLRPADAARWSRLFLHALTTAFGACHLMTRRTHRHSDATFLGGLFHDVGKAVAFRAIGTLVDQGRMSPPSERVLDVALQSLHREPTSVLYDSWSLPSPLLTICKHHHRLCEDATPELHFVRLVSAFDVLRVGPALEQSEALQEISESTTALALTGPELRVAHTESREYGERVEKMFA